MMSTSLLERQESNGAGQRHGNGFNQHPPVSRTEAYIDVSQNPTDSSGRDRRRRG